MDITGVQYVYLIHKKEFVDSNTPIYKIGRTKQLNHLRFSSYPKGSKVLLQSNCNDCISCENKIIYHFDRTYKKRPEIGNEYYEGDYKKMKEDIEKIIREDDLEFDEREKQNYGNIFTEESTQVIDNIVIEPNIEISEKKYNCEKCLYSTDTKYNFQNHNKSKSHIDKQEIGYQPKYECTKCKKGYSSHSGLWKHKTHCNKICRTIKKENEIKYESSLEQLIQNQIELTKTVKNMEKMIMDLNKK